MKTTGVTPVLRWPPEADGPVEDLVAGEVPVALSYNRHPHVVMMATPRDLEDLAVGFSLTEGIVRGAGDIHAVRVIEREDGLEAAITVGDAVAGRLRDLRRNLTGRTGCGLCGAETLAQAVRLPAPVGNGLRLSHEALQRALCALPSEQPLQAATGAVHCAAWCGTDGRLKVVREDVGRHNALDKLIGHLARSGMDARRGFLLVSSRASYEMVLKTAAAGVELLAAVSAPTTLAVGLAERCGVTLVGFARPGRHNVYSGAERLSATREETVQ